jgi:hypothetical protein
LTLAFLAVPASSPSQAASISFSDPNCASYALTGSNGSYTLTCASLNCSVAATPSANVIPGNPIALTTTCVPAASGNATYAWTMTGGDAANCPAANETTSQISKTANNTTSPACTYQVTVTDGANGGGTASKTVNWSNVVAAPTGCSITGLPGGTQTPPYSYNLGVTCSGGGAPTAYQWSGGSSATTQTISGSISSTTTFNVVASNSGGNQTGPSQSSGTITVNSGGGGGSSCAGFAATHNISIAWGSTAQTMTAANGGFGPLDAVVLKIVVPGNVGTFTKKGTFAGVEYSNDPPSARYGTVSTQPCDFAGTSAVSVFGGGTQIFCLANQVCSTNLSFSFAFSPLKVGSAQFQAGQTYYVNIANTPGTCYANGSCNMLFNWGWPTQ